MISKMMFSFIKIFFIYFLLWPSFSFGQQPDPKKPTSDPEKTEEAEEQEEPKEQEKQSKERLPFVIKQANVLFMTPLV